MDATNCQEVLRNYIVVIGDQRLVRTLQRWFVCIGGVVCVRPTKLSENVSPLYA
jgi:hypothetical protein